MSYFKHSELARQHHVALKTVYNWIEAAKQGKLALELIEYKDRVYIADTQANVATIRQLAQEGKKYRNSRFQKILTPQPKFYDLFSRQQMLDIITNLSTHGEIPRQYNYFDQGATTWDERMRRDSEARETNSSLKGAQELLHTNLPAIDHLTEDYSRINVVDVGPGNAFPVRELLEHLLERNALQRYIAVDLSAEMLHIAEQNLKSWFGEQFPFEGYLRDITHERFNDVLIDDMLNKHADETLNLVLFFGDTALNFRDFSDPIKTIYGSMDANSLLICANKPDTEASRGYFQFNPNPGSTELPPNYRLLPELLGISKDLYDVEMDFDERRRMRYVRIRLNTALTIRFQFDDSEHDVNLEKGSTILLLRVWHYSALELIDKYQAPGLTLLQSSMTKDRNYLLTIFGMEEVETKI